MKLIFFIFFFLTKKDEDGEYGVDRYQGDKENIFAATAFAVLRQVHPDLTLSLDACNYISSLADGVTLKLVAEMDKVGYQVLIKFLIFNF
jgi:hypothetical protein